MINSIIQWLIYTGSGIINIWLNIYPKVLLSMSVCIWPLSDIFLYQIWFEAVPSVLMWNLSLFDYSRYWKREIFHIKNRQTDRVKYRVASQLKRSVIINAEMSLKSRIYHIEVTSFTVLIYIISLLCLMWGAGRFTFFVRQSQKIFILLRNLP